MRAVLLAFVWLNILFFFIVAKPEAQTVTYAYDELGRLVAVVEPSGNAGVYDYDKVGNLQSISNTTSSTVSIFTFTPNNGPAGLSITIYGDGFSTTPSSNTVTFNGTAATVSSSTVAAIVVAVPAGATTGPITVTSPNGKASSTNFTVN